MTRSDTQSSVCPSEDVFVLMLQQELSHNERVELEAHLDECALCSQLVVELAELLSFHGVSIQSFESADALPEDSPQPAPMHCTGYELLGVLGAGGMGVVYRARDVTLGREVAIKVIRADALGAAQAEQLSARLVREARMLARVNHPNVVTIHEANVETERIYLVMELVEGASLDRVLRTRQLDWRQIVALFLQVCEGLMAAHRVGVIHRDIKPSNIIVTPDDRAVLTDFGLARAAMEQPDDAGTSLMKSSLTRSGAVLGTPAYMPPEQHLGGVADERSDIFSLCASLYAALFGERPFAGERIEEVALNACSGEVRTPTQDHGVPKPMLEVLRRGMARRKEDRFEDVHALREAIEMASRSMAARSATRERVALLAAMLLLTGSLVWWIGRREAPPASHADVRASDTVQSRTLARDFSPARAAIVSGVESARLAVVRVGAMRRAARARDMASDEVRRGPERVPARPVRVMVASAPEEHVERAPGGERAGSTDDMMAARRIGAATQRARRAFMNHDVEGCFAALDGLPEQDANVMLFASQCMAIDGRCEQGLKMYGEAFDRFGAGKDAAQLDAEYRPLCSPSKEDELAHFMWRLEVFYQADLATCRARGARLMHELELVTFRDRLVEAGHKRDLINRLRVGLNCLGRSKQDECALARRISTLIIELEQPGLDPAQIDALHAEYFRAAGGMLAECATP